MCHGGEKCVVNLASNSSPIMQNKTKEIHDFNSPPGTMFEAWMKVTK